MRNGKIWKAIRKEDKKYLKVVFETIMDATESENKGRSGKRSKNIYPEPLGKLKTSLYQGLFRLQRRRAHQSYLFRTGSVPGRLDGAREGVDQMARLRVFAANGGNLSNLALRKKQERIRRNKSHRTGFKSMQKKDEKSSRRNNRQSACS